VVNGVDVALSWLDEVPVFAEGLECPDESDAGDRFDGSNAIHAGGSRRPCPGGPILFAAGFKGSVKDILSDAPSNNPFGVFTLFQLLLGIPTCCSSFVRELGSSTQREHTGGSLAIIPCLCGWPSMSRYGGGFNGDFISNQCA
jgi:hypothetical protein